MADEVFDSTDMVRQLLREGQSVTDEAGDTLPHSVIEALDMIGFAGLLCDGLVLRRGNDPRCRPHIDPYRRSPARGTPQADWPTTVARSHDCDHRRGRQLRLSRFMVYCASHHRRHHSCEFITIKHANAYRA